MTTRLKADILEALQLLQGFQNFMVRIDDWICITGRNYDRHSTSYGKIILEIQEFRVRTSGAVATLYGGNQQIEFRTDAIKQVEITPDGLVVEICLADNVWRRIAVSKLSQS